MSSGAGSTGQPGPPADRQGRESEPGRAPTGPRADVSTAVVARISALVADHGLDPSAAPRLAQLTEILGAPGAPSSVSDPAAILDAHVADSLAGLRVPELSAASRIADLGSGAGLPGLALAIVLPAVEVDLIESIRRKCSFMAGAIAALGIANAGVVHARVEEWRAGHGRCDVVTARALAPAAVLVEYAAPLLADDGVLVAWKGAMDAGERSEGARAAQEVGLRPEASIRVAPTADTRDKRLEVYRKVAPTPSRFPRRPGRARKAPLGTSRD